MANSIAGIITTIITMAAGLVPMLPFEQEEKRYADERAASEADELSFREVEQHLGFYFG